MKIKDLQEKLEYMYDTYGNVEVMLEGLEDITDIDIVYYCMMDGERTIMISGK